MRCVPKSSRSKGAPRASASPTPAGAAPSTALSARFLGRLKGLAGDLAPNRLGIMEGPVETAPRRSAPKTAGTAEPSATLIAAAKEITDDSLRREFLETAARYQSRFGS